jgi:hypothetical protein
VKAIPSTRGIFRSQIREVERLCLDLVQRFSPSGVIDDVPASRSSTTALASFASSSTTRIDAPAIASIGSSRACDAGPGGNLAPDTGSST